MRVPSVSHCCGSMLRLMLLCALLAAFSLVPSQPVLAGNNGGNMLTFDGNNDYVIRNYDGTALTALTVEMWVNPSSNTSGPGLFQWANTLGAGTPFILLRKSAATTVSLYVNGDYRLTAPLNRDEWTHLAITYSGGVWSFYRNGGTPSTYTGGVVHQPNAQSIYLGNGFSGFWGGTLDEVRIWTVARTQAQIQAGMFQEITAPQTGLGLYYRLNEASGTTTADLSGNARTGTLTNFPASPWTTSTAPIADSTVGGQTGIAGIWVGSTTASSGGLTFADGAGSNFLKNLGDDIVFGHNNLSASATTNTDLPTDSSWNTATAPARLQRTWYCDLNDTGANSGGNLNLTFTLATTPSTAANYRLLERAGTSGQFTDITAASGATVSVNGPAKTVTFTGVDGGTVCSHITLGTLNSSASPTSVGLTSLTASAGANGNTVAWETASEYDIQGFQILRSATGARADATLVTSELIAAMGDGVSGAGYSWIDQSATATTAYTYWLQELRSDGTSADLGSVKLSGQLNQRERKVFLPLVLR